MSVRRSRQQLAILLTALLCGLLLSAALAGRHARQLEWQQRGLEAQGQLELYQQSLRTLVERFRAVPAIVALDSQLQIALQMAGDAQRQQDLSARLQRLNAEAGAGALYVLDASGLTIASSNWQEPGSFVGHNYSFRPYFQQALAEGSGRYFAVGITTGVPGYFLSHRVEDARGRPLGVVVLKLEMEELQRDWAGQPGTLLVTDSYGIAILASRPHWRFRYLPGLSAAQLAEAVSSRKYAEQNLQLLPRQLRQVLGDIGELQRVDGPDGRHDYLWLRQPLPEDGWTLHLLHRADPADAGVLSYQLAAAALWLALAFLLLFVLQWRRNRLLRLRQRAELEKLVAARTAQLRQAQDELVQATKMAALGQMSAALAHEINQPLTALRMQLGSLGLLLQRGDAAKSADCLQRCDGLLTRMAALTGHLKTFARNSPGGLRERLVLDDAIDHALLLLEVRIRQDRVQVLRQRVPQAWVEGDAIRLEQVVVNLMHNALDAMRGSPLRELRIAISRSGSDWLLTVADSGGGIAPEHLPHVFEPFFTTKPVGEGLGLGLAVSYGIVRELGGQLEAGNAGSGAVFSLRLPALDDIATHNKEQA